MGNKKSGQTAQSTNSDSAELAAGVTAAAPAPAPLIAMALSDPDALENVKRRVSQAKAKRGRASLRIPLGAASGVSSGIAIPR